jgi:hypothetical protein
VVPYFCDTLEEAEEAVRLTTRALMRTNLMDCVYKSEVRRTNRIGVGLTGIFEFAWKFFKLGFRDILDEHGTGKPFWEAINRLSLAVKDEAKTYAMKLGVNVPHTDTTIKPAGTTSKLFNLTEGAHLPSMRQYLRWVQYKEDNPLIASFKKLGYKVKHLKTYKGTAIVAFPTIPELCKTGIPSQKLVTASEATPEEQYKWIQLLEKYWLRETGNQISYTLKYNPKTVSMNNLYDTVITYQHTVRCCSVMPQKDESNYEYQPEEAVTLEEYNEYVTAIKAEVEEDVDRSHVDCAGGACPINFDKKESA